MAIESPSQEPPKHPSAQPAKVWVFVVLLIAYSCAPAATPAPTAAPAATEPPSLTQAPILPSFPWPPPKPSAKADLSLGSIGNAAGAGSTFGDVASRIASALTLRGYDERSYYSVPGGFAIVTGLEQMTSDGYPENSQRWVAELAPMSFESFSMDKYIQALFSAPKGHYRVFVFIVTSEVVIQSGTPVSQAEAKTWVVEGGNKLPDWMDTLPYTKEHACTVFVYEFIQSGVGEEANQNIPSEITGKQHLERAGLWDILER